MILIPSFHLRLLSSLDFDEPFDDDNPDDTVNGNDDFGGDDFAIVDKCVAEGGIDASFSVGEIDTDVLNEDKLDDDERNSKTDVCSCSGNNDNFINCLEDNDDNSGDGVASNNGDVVDKGGVVGEDDVDNELCADASSSAPDNSSFSCSILGGDNKFNTGNCDGVKNGGNVGDDGCERFDDKGCDMVTCECAEFDTDGICIDDCGSKGFDDSACDDEYSNGDEVDDKPFDHDDNDRSMLARAFGSQCVGIVVDDDVVDDGCADP